MGSTGRLRSQWTHSSLKTIYVLHISTQEAPKTSFLPLADWIDGDPVSAMDIRGYST